MASSGNFAVFSIPTRPESGYSSSDQITGGGLSIKPPSSGSFEPVIATISPNSGKWYWEYRAGQGGGSSYGRPAIATSEQTVVKNEDLSGGQSGQVGVLFLANDGQKRINGSSTSYGNAVSQHDIVQVALDCDNGAVYFGINNTWQNSGDPTSGSSKTGAALTAGIQNVDIDILHTRYVGGGVDQYNFGQDDTFGGAITAAGNADGNGHGVFKYSPPSGYLALCSANLPISDDIDPAQTDDDYPGKQFAPILYTGNGTSNNAITGLGFQPDLVWTKNRGNVADYSNALVDSSRGRAKVLYSQRTDAEPSDSGASDDLKSFDSDGFTVGTGNNISINANTHTYVGWCWRANGGTTSTNEEGNHDCTLQANPKAGFSIMTLGNYTSASGVTIGHGLDKAPSFYIHKSRANSGAWHVYHSGIGATKALVLNTTAAQATAIGYWANTEPTADVLSLGNTFAGTGNGVVYAWAEVEGYSKFGTYIGNGDADGPFIYTGFKPAMYFVKIASAVNNWFTYDILREGYNEENETLSWNNNTVEDNTYEHDIYSNGFKARDSNNATNQSGQTFIYGAWADVPFKYNNTF
jgi:hypothetical protein